MISHETNRKRKTWLVMVAMLCLTMAASALAGCAGQNAASSAASSADASAQASQDTAGADAGSDTASGEAGQASASAIDPTAWKTLGDALDAQTSPMTAGWDDNYYVTMFQAGEAYFRVVATMTPEVDKKIDEADWSSSNVGESIEKAARELSLASAEDVTSQLIGQEELNKLVGKTGKELVADGFTFESYPMYGDKQSIASFAKGPFSYGFTFEVAVGEDATMDDGASVMNAPATAVEFLGAAESATDPSKVS